MEHVRNDLGSIPMRRSGVVDGVTPHEQKNIVSSYLDGWAIYGGTQDRLTWLRDGAKLLMPGNMLPRRQARGGDGSDAPVMTGPFGAITTGTGVVAGDMRANEFATVGYRSHSMVRGDFKVVTQASRYAPQQLDALRGRGMTVAVSGEATESFPADPERTPGDEITTRTASTTCGPASVARPRPLG